MSQFANKKSLPFPFATNILLVVNLTVYVWMFRQGEQVAAWHADYLLTWGANYAPETMHGQWWRLFSCMFVHGGILHLLFNMWMLWQLGRLVERILRTPGFLVLYVSSGLCCGIAGLWLSPFAVISGASGALFGLVGSLFSFLIVNRRNRGAECLRQLRDNALFFVGYNIVLGLLIEQVDLVGHTSGFVAGFVLGLILMQPKSNTIAGRLWRNTLATGFALGLVYCALFCLPRAPDDFFSEMDRFTAMERECLEEYGEANQHFTAGHFSKQTFLEVLDDKLIPKWRLVGRTVVAINRFPANHQHLKPKIISYVKTREESFRLLAEGLREHDQSKLSRHRDKWDAAEQMARLISNQG